LRFFFIFSFYLAFISFFNQINTLRASTRKRVVEVLLFLHPLIIYQNNNFVNFFGILPFFVVFVVGYIFYITAFFITLIKLINPNKKCNNKESYHNVNGYHIL